MDEEGLQSTENKLIHIGKPIDFDEQQFLKDLEELYHAAYEEEEGMKEIVHKIVPTYHIRQEDIERDQKIASELMKDFSDTRSKLPSEFLNKRK